MRKEVRASEPFVVIIRKALGKDPSGRHILPRDQRTGYIPDELRDYSQYNPRPNIRPYLFARPHHIIESS